MVPGQIEVDTPPQQVGNSRNSLGYQQPEDEMDTTPDAPSRKIALVDGMVLVQQMAKKRATIVTVKDLSECFNDRLMSFT